MDFLDDSNPFFDAGTMPAAASSPTQQGHGSNGLRDDGMTTLMLEEFDSRNVRTCVHCKKEKKVAEFPMSFRKAKECKFCVVLKKRGHLCMPSDISDEFSSAAAPQEQHQQEQLARQGEPSSPDRSRSHTRRGSLNITPVLTKSLRNLLSKGDAAMAPPLAVSTVPDAQYV